MTAWLAKVRTSSTWRWLNGPGSGRSSNKAPSHPVVTEQRYAEHGTCFVHAIDGQNNFGVFQHVDDVLDLAGKQDTPCHRTPPRFRGISGENFLRHSGLTPAEARQTVFIPVAQADGAIVGATEFDGRGDQRVEHRLQIERRTADNFKHVGGRGLLFQRLLRLVEQPCVLDRDHRLVGEGAQKLDLPLGERSDAVTVDPKRAYNLPVPQQRHDEYGAQPATLTDSGTA